MDVKSVQRITLSNQFLSLIFIEVCFKVLHEMITVPLMKWINRISDSILAIKSTVVFHTRTKPFSSSFFRTSKTDISITANRIQVLQRQLTIVSSMVVILAVALILGLLLLVNIYH